MENLNSLRSSADINSTGILTRPKVSAPFQIERGISYLFGFRNFDREALDADPGAAQHEQIAATDAWRESQLSRFFAAAACTRGPLANLKIDRTDRHRQSLSAA